MASRLLPATPRPKSHTRTASLDSGGRLTIPKCVNGNCAEISQRPMPERRPPRPVNVEQKRTLASSRGTDVHDDHNKVKEQLASIERSKSNLMQDLVRAKRNVEELTTKLNGVNGPCRKDKARTVETEIATFLDKEGWQVELDAMKQQYESALMELQTSKQAMESLKHELMVCVEAKDEAVRLAGEAMNAAESTARRVEELSVELFTTKGSVLPVDREASEMDDLIGELPGARHSLLEIEVPLGKVAQEKSFMPIIEESKGQDFMESFSSARAEITDKRVDIVQVKDQERQSNNLASALKDLESELAAAKEAEQKALNDMLAMHANIERANLEAEKAKSAESAAASLLTKVSKELEEAEEKLVKASVEGATLVASLGFLKAELEKSQQDLIETRDRETKANCKAAELSDCMKNMRAESQAEVVMYKERETSTHAKIESLQMEIEKHKSELVMAADREMVAAAKVADMIGEIQKSRSELIEHQKHSTCEVAALRANLEENESKLVTLEERESLSANKISTLMFDLEKKQSEVGDLQQRLLEMESKAEAVSVELLNLQEKGLYLAAKEEEVTAKMAALNVEVLGLKKDLEEALNLGQVAREDLSKVEVTLQQAMSDRDEARHEVQAAYCQMELSRKISEDALAESQASKQSLERALELMHRASNAAMEEVLIASKLAKEAAQIASEEACAAEEKLQVALKHAEMASAEMETIRKEAQSAREDADLQKTALAAEKERANAIEEEAKAVLNEMVKLRTELAKSQADETEAKAAWADAESRLQDSREELEAQKIMAIKAERHAGDLSQEELAGLKEKLRVSEEQLKVSTSEVEALQMNKGELLRELETVKADRESSKRAVLEAHQHLADLEKAKRVMEADIQRLLDDSKLWKTPKDTRDILVLSEVNGNSYVLAMDSREEKPQPESPDRESFQGLSMADLPMDGEKSMADLPTVIEKEEETEAPPEETPSRAVKKKKHALLHRLHSYLDKKKSLNT